MKRLSDGVEFSTAPVGGRIGDAAVETGLASVMLHGRLEFNSMRSVADANDARWVAHAKNQIRRSIAEMIQPRAEFEAAFQELRDKIQGLNLSSMSDTMAVLGAIAELKEKLLLR